MDPEIMVGEAGRVNLSEFPDGWGSSLVSILW